MRNRLLRPFLIFEFLIAIIAVFTLWSQVGGQYHLDLMFWPWKLGLGGAAAALIVAITWRLAKAEGAIPRQVWMLCSLLIAVMAIAGVVTWFYHLYEPADEDPQDDQAAQTTSARYQTRHALPPRTMGRPALHAKAF